MLTKAYLAHVLVPDNEGNQIVIKEEINLNALQIVKFSILGNVKVGKRIRPGWKQAIMYYLVKGECGHIFLDYLHGHYGWFICPVCNQ